MPEDKEHPLLGQTALVTGGAKRLGRAIALALGRAGADVVVHCRGSLAEAQALAGELRGLGRQAWTAQADLDDASQVEALFADACRSAGGGLDILVNSASIFPTGRLDGLQPAELERNIRVNALAPFVLGRALARSGRGGCIVNLLDSRITDYDAEHAAYHLSKRLLATFTRMMALEYAPKVRVNAVAPGLILPPPGEGQDYLERLKGTNPLQRHGGPEDVADAVLFLARSAFVTGQTIFVDGGRHMRGAVYG
ncbi:MAG: SDR family oxidoreductase [Elusimicrobia bacterium]|nr:SDR family oxidoreductase [Elusimicrobiota bacterium]